MNDMQRLCATVLVATGVWLVTPAVADAQIRASELQSIAQTVDGTTLRVTYSRPRLRGRWPIFGTNAVQWDEVWTPGANWATLLEVNKDITMSGTTIPKGKYSVWMVVSQDSTWTMLLDPKWKQYHTDHPKPNDTQIAVRVSADTTAPRVELLTFAFPSVSVRGGTLEMRWANVRVSMNYAVTPSLTELLAEPEARPYLGTYAIADPASPGDSSKFIVSYERGGLKARFEPGDSYLQTFALMRTGPNVFTVGLYASAEVYADGEIYEVLRPDMMFTFAMVGGVMTFECRNEDDTLLFSGRRR